MNVYRSHTLRSLTIYFLMAGFMVHLLIPFSSSAQKSAFTKWLDHNVVTTGNDYEAKVRSLIRDLHTQEGDFNQLLQQASELVTAHKDHFRIHFQFDENAEHQKVTGWLIGQWNVFQNHHSGNNAILPEIHQTIQKWISSNTPSSAFLNHSEKLQKERLSNFDLQLFGEKAMRLLPPLASGISINAP